MKDTGVHVGYVIIVFFIKKSTVNVQINFKMK